MDARFYETETPSFCSELLSGTTTAASAIPTDYNNCDVAAASSACSCMFETTGLLSKGANSNPGIVYTLTHTSSSSSSTSSSYSASTTSESTTTSAPYTTSTSSSYVISTPTTTPSSTYSTYVPSSSITTSSVPYTTSTVYTTKVNIRISRK